MTSWKSRGWVAIGALALVYALSLALPLQPRFFDASFDSSWQFVLHEAFASERAFGRDIIFTFGPFGFLYTADYHPATYPWLLVAWAFFAVALWWGVLTIARRSVTNPLLAVLWLAAVIGTALSGADETFFSLDALLLVTHFYVDDRPVRSATLLFTLAAALAGLVKFPFFLLAAVVVAAIAADEIVQKHPPAVLFAFAGAVLGFWLLAGQDPVAFWDYVRNSMEVSGAYGEAMAVGGPGDEVGLFVAAAALLVGLIAAAEWRGRRRGWWVPVAGFAGIAFLVFKSGYVRHDWHATIAGLGLLEVALLCSAVLWSRLAEWTLRGLQVLALALAVVVAWVSMARHEISMVRPLISLPEYYWSTVSHLPGSLVIAARGAGGQIPLRARYEAHLASMRASRPLPPISGTADVYSWSQPIIFANGLRYSPRPLIQSYVAFTPALAEIDAGHLRDRSAPETILFNVETIDGRYPSLDDSLSWPELLTRYDVRFDTGSFLVLGRAQSARSFRLDPVGEIDGRLFSRIDIPSIETGPIWARMDIEPTLVGRLISQLFRAPPLFLSVLTRDGHVRKYRLIASMARAGFLLTPLVDNRFSFAQLASTEWRTALADSAVSAMAVSSESAGSRFYRSEFKISFFRLDYPRQDLSQLRQRR